MVDIEFRILVTVASVALVGVMTWDQYRLRQMNPMKWVLAPLMVVLFSFQAWIY
jgi:hypothetical protein